MNSPLKRALTIKGLRYVIIQTGPGVHPASYPMSTGGPFPGLKRPRREADHSLQTSVEVKDTWIHTSIPLYVFIE
jgi:hypothetical protein